MDLDLSMFAAEDTAEWDVPHPVTGEPSGWKWTFAGPGHPQTVEAANRATRRRLEEEKRMEAARVNGKKWKPEDRTVEELRRENVRLVVDRLIGWTPIKINGEDYPFSRENAESLLLNPAMVRLYNGAIGFLADEESFTPRSATE